MPQRIKHDDIVDGSLFGQTVKELEQAVSLIKELKEELKKAAAVKPPLSPNPNNTAELEKLVKEAEKLNDAYVQAKKLDNQLLKTEKKLIDARGAQSKAIAKNSEELKAQNKLNRESAKNKLDLITLNNKESGTLEKLAASNRILRAERQKLNFDTKKGKARLIEINRALDLNNAKIEKNSDKLKAQKIGIGRYSKALNGLKGILTSIGVGLGLSALVSGFRELNALASEVKGVEFAFKRLGIEGDKAFKAVQKSTRGLVSNLDIKKSLVEFDNFNISLEDAGKLMEFVAVRSAQTGQSVEFLTNSLNEGLSKGSLRRLDNLGVSMIAMRKEMEKTGASVVEAFTAIAGKEVQRAGKILDEAGNSQQRWNASLENTRVAISKITQSGFALMLKDAASSTLELLFPTEKLSEQYSKQQIELNVLVNQITDTNIAEDERLSLINKLNDEYPTFLKNLSDEETSNENIADRLIEVNDLYIKRIVLQIQQEKIEKAFAKAAKESSEAVNRSLEAGKEAVKVNRDLELNLNLTNKSYSERIDIVRDALKEEAKYVKGGIMDQVTLAANKQAKALDRINGILFQRDVRLFKSKKATEALVTEQNNLVDIEKEFQKTLEQINNLLEGPPKKRIREARELTKEEKKAIKDREKRLKKAQKLAEESQEFFNNLGKDAQEQEIRRLENSHKLQLKMLNEFNIDTTNLVIAHKNQINEINLKFGKIEAERLRKEREAKQKALKKEQDDQRKEQEAADKISQKNFDDELAAEKKFQDQRNQNAISSIEKAEKDAFDKRIRLIDDEIDANKRRVDTLKLLAAQGNKDASESIALAEKKQKELELERERRFKRQKTIEVVTSGLEVYRAKVAAGDPNAELNTLASVGALIAGLTSISGFKDGTESLKKGSNIMDIGTNRDNLIIRAEEDERIMTAKQNAPLAGLSNDTLSMVGSLYKKGLLEPIQSDLQGGMVMTFNISELVKETQEVKAAIKNLPSQMPISKTDYDTIAGIIIDKVTRGGHTTITKRKNR